MKRFCISCLLVGLMVVSPAFAQVSQTDKIAELEKRIQELEANQQQTQEALDSEHLSAKDPDWVTRIKALERDGGFYKKMARKVETLEEVEADVSLVNVLQNIKTGGQDQLYNNYRVDASIGIPAGNIGRNTGSLFFHVRAGQSPDYSELHESFTGLNSTAFQLGGTAVPEDSSLTLIEAWYQLDIPFKKFHSLKLNLGKLDPFVFFDQNGIANDEGMQFIASPFVHNAILDNPIAAQIGTDAYGATPGLRVAWEYEASSELFSLSAGIFGAGDDAIYKDSFNKNFSITQAAWQTRFWGYVGAFRLYAWKNTAGSTYAENAEHDGIGISVDQELANGVSVFLRYGSVDGERLPFDKTHSVGFMLRGDAWNRSADKLGLAYAVHSSSDDFKRDAPFSYAVSDQESVMELYYLWYFNEQFLLSLHAQAVHHAGASEEADSAKGLAARLSWLW